MIAKSIRLFVAATLAVMIGTVSVRAADDSIAAARDLYASAAYEDALAVLNRLRAAGQTGHDAEAVEEYRAFCLLALGRSTEAQDAIAAVVTAEPSFNPSGAEVSPRIRTAFSDDRSLQALAARSLARKEGIFAGYSSGANIAAAMKLCAGRTVVTIINDSGLKYLSTDLWL